MKEESEKNSIKTENLLEKIKNLSLVISKSVNVIELNDNLEDYEILENSTNFLKSNGLEFSNEQNIGKNIEDFQINNYIPKK